MKKVYELIVRNIDTLEDESIRFFESKEEALEELEYLALDSSEWEGVINVALV